MVPLPICPKHWQLPSGKGTQKETETDGWYYEPFPENGSYYGLLSHYGWTLDVVAYHSIRGSSVWEENDVQYDGHLDPFYLNAVGWLDPNRGGQHEIQHGYFLLKTAKPTLGAYELAITSNQIAPVHPGGISYHGITLRCLTQ